MKRGKGWNRGSNALQRLIRQPPRRNLRVRWGVKCTHTRTHGHVHTPTIDENSKSSLGKSIRGEVNASMYYSLRLRSCNKVANRVEKLGTAKEWWRRVDGEGRGRRKFSGEFMCVWRWPVQRFGNTWSLIYENDAPFLATLLPSSARIHEETKEEKSSRPTVSLVPGNFGENFVTKTDKE